MARPWPLLFLLLLFPAFAGLDLILKSSYTTLEGCLEGYRTWADCILPGEEGQMATCKGYYLGASITEDVLAATGPITAVAVNISGVYWGYFKISTITEAGNYSLSLLHKDISGKLLLIPISKSLLLDLTDYWIEVTLVGEQGNYSKKISFTPIFTQGGCDNGIEETVSGYRLLSDYATAICYTDEDCYSFREPTAGTAALCRDIPPDIVSYGAPPAKSYAFAKICMEVCGNGVCNAEVESPGLCSSDCCTSLGTGAEGTPYEGICYEACGADAPCEVKQPGYLADDGSYVCSRSCKAITEPTNVVSVDLLQKVNGSCLMVNASWEECNFTVFYPRESPYTLEIEFSSEMWTENNGEGSVEYSGAGIFSGLSGTLQFQNPPAYDFGFTLPGAGSFTGMLKFRYTYRLPSFVKVNIKAIYPSDAYLELPGCVSRAPVEGCLPALIFNITFPEAFTSKLQNPTEVYYKCSSLDETAEGEVLLNPGEEAKVTVTISLPEGAAVGPSSVTCRIYGPEIEEKTLEGSFKILGKIVKAEFSTPPQLIKGKTYSVSIFSVEDDAGKRLSSYSYYIYLQKDGKVFPLSFNYPVFSVPKGVEEGLAKICMEFSAEYLVPLKICRNIEVVEKLPLEMAVYPSTIYFPLRGGRRVFYVTLRNLENEILEPKVTFSYPSEINLTAPGFQEISLLPFETKKMPVIVELPPLKSPKEEKVTILVALADKLVGKWDIKLVATTESYAEYHVEPEKITVEFVDPPGRVNISLCNVGTVEDSYILLPDEGLRVGTVQLQLPPGECREVEVAAEHPGIYNLCIKSAKLYKEGARCVEITAKAINVTPEVSLITEQFSTALGTHKKLEFLIKTANYSGPYSFVLLSPLVNYTTQFYAERDTEKVIEVGFEVKKYGAYLLKVIVIPGSYTHKKATASFWVEITPKIPLEVVDRLRDLENLALNLPEEAVTKYQDKITKLREEIYTGEVKEPEKEIRKLEEEMKLEIASSRYGRTAASMRIYKPGGILKLLSIAAFIGGAALYFIVARGGI